MYVQVKKKKETFRLLLVLFVIFCINILYTYSTYMDFKKHNFLSVDAQVVNIYKKQKFDILKLKTKSYNFFTKIKKNIQIKKNDMVNIVIISKNISFWSYLKGFYSNNIRIYYLKSPKNKIVSYINTQHQNDKIKEVFQALFLAIPLSSDLRDKFASFGISHIIAISGFHLSLISFILYWLIYPLYSFVHQKKFPYRNKRFDILVIVICVLFSYVILTGVVPSLLRAFVMFILGLYLLRCNIKILSFSTLFLTLLIIIALFPKYIFSLSLWFSMSGVFFIFLYLKYFSKLNKYFQVVFFNYWIFLSMNPLTHYFFSTTSKEQLYSPVITFLFIIFYPIELFLHFIKQSSLMDSIILYFLNYKIETYDIATPLYFFVIYLILSYKSISSKYAFIVLNLFLIGFNIYLYI